MNSTSTPRIVALADDLTGALEVGANFAQYALPATVITDLEALIHSECPVLVVDSETRHLPANQAAARIRHVATLIKDLSPWLIYKKTDSTLRGNIAAELGAIHNVFPGSQVVYVPAYPDMGRIVRGGELFVWGKPVHETEFANDPWSPVRNSKFDALLGDVPAVVLDGESNADIDAAVGAILEDPTPHLAAGPAALAGALARHLHLEAKRSLQLPSGLRFLVVNGSVHPASVQQMAFAEEHGLFDHRWVRLDEKVEGSGRERALRIGECVRRTLNSAAFDGLIVFGGDTAFGIHHALGEHPLQAEGEILTGVPVARSGGLIWITKAGGFGLPDVLSVIRNRLI